jgi:hypothetical protein
LPEPLDHGVVDQAQQPATMDAELREGVTSFDTAQFLPDDLAEPVRIDQFARADPGCIEGVRQSEFGQKGRRHAAAC